MQTNKQKKSLIKQNILTFIASIGISQYDFYKKTGITRGILAQDNGISEDNITRFLAYYQMVNPTWLVTGQGDMLIDQSTVFDNNILPTTGIASGVKYNTQYIPLYSIEATASILSTFADGAIIPEGHLQIPNLTKVDGAVYVTGDSMYPILKSGDIVVFQQIHNVEYIVYGNVYLVSFNIDGDEYIVLKYIQKSEQDSYIKLVSHNQHHSDFDIPRSSIRALALVKASIRYNSL